MIDARILEERKTGLGGSDVAAVLGLSRYATPADIWLEKIGRGKEKQVTELMHFGNKLEAVIADEFADRNKVSLMEPTQMYRHPEHSFLIANPDRLIYHRHEIVECKNVSAYRAKEWGEEGTDNIPTEYLLQVAHYRYVMRLDCVHIAALLGGNEYRQYRYTENKELETRLVEKLIKFWKDYVEPRVEPPLTTRRDVEALLRPTDRVIEADKNLRANFERLSEYKQDAAKIEEEIAKIQDEICVALGDASIVIDGNGEKICTYKDVTSKRFDSTAFKNEHGEIHAKYLKESVSRVLRMNSAYNFNYGG
jgi:putative phage-type endonuclease